MAQLLRDLRVGLRALLRTPAFSAVAVLTLALGVGVNGAVFSVISGTLINPTPWKDVDGLVFLVDANLERRVQNGPVSLPRFQDVRSQSTLLSDLSASRGYSFVLTDRDVPESVRGALVSPELFGVLGLETVIGRPLSRADAEPAAPCAIVLDHRIWVDRYGSDPGITQREIELENRPCQVVGVLSSSVWFPTPGTSILAPLREESGQARDRRDLIVVGRLREGADRSGVQAELDVVSDRLAAQFADFDTGWRLRGVEVVDLLFGPPARRSVAVLVGAIGFMMLIACANLTGLLLTRAASRAGELAVRAALGASRGQLIRHLLAENLVLLLAGIPLALLVARATLELLYRQVPQQVLQVDRLVRFDPPVWIFVGGAALLTVLVFGLTPALRASRVNLVHSLKSSGARTSSGAGSQRLRSLLVVAQLSGSVVLLVGASLLGQSFLQFVRADTGVDQSSLFYAPMVLPESRYPSEAQRAELGRSIGEQLAAIPAIRAVGVSDSAVTAAGGPMRRVKVVGQASRVGSEVVEVKWTAASPGFLQALGLQQQLGRSLQESDDAQGRRVALVSRSFAAAWFPQSESPLGRTIADEDGREVEIVGVVQDVKQLGLGTTQRPQVFVPFAQQPSTFLQIVARTQGAPLAVGPEVRRVIEAIDPLLPIYRLTTVLQERTDAAWTLAAFAAALALLGGVGLFMASIGIYGVIHYSTQQRVREFGIRCALGASPLGLMLLVFRRAAALVGAGLVCGLLLAAALSRALGTLLYEVDAFQPMSFALPVLLLGGAALAAAAVPAARVVRTDPMIALRCE